MTITTITIILIVKLLITFLKQYLTLPIGYKSYHDRILLRKVIKQNFKNMINKYPNNESKASYYRWLCHANTINLQNKYLWK